MRPAIPRKRSRLLLPFKHIIATRLPAITGLVLKTPHLSFQAAIRYIVDPPSYYSGLSFVTHPQLRFFTLHSFNHSLRHGGASII